MPSIVVTLEPAAWPASTVQDLTARPSIWTVQAPHWLVSQPIWVPVRLRFSRSRWTRSVRSSTSAETALPLIVSSILDILNPPDFIFSSDLGPNQRRRRPGSAVLAEMTKAVTALPMEYERVKLGSN